jgi:hypothetical protein
MGFYTFTLGFWEDELDDIPEAKRFIEMQMTVVDDQYEDLHILSPEGKLYLHEYIKDISEKFIDYMKHNGYECSHNDVYGWFVKTFGLDTEEDGKDIAEYICMNLYHYGYRVHRCCSYRKGNFYRIEKM